MQFVILIIVVAGTFGLCHLLDKCFSEVFRGKAQHKSGLAVRLNKRYALFGVILLLLGILAIAVGVGGTLVLLIGGAIVLLMGIALTAYYAAFGVFYNDDSFLQSSIGKKSVVYRFADIKEQRLYQLQGGGLVIELHMTDGKALSLQSSMDGVFPFLDHAFRAWCAQTGRDPENCDFHDPSQSLWFPSQEDA